MPSLARPETTRLDATAWTEAALQLLATSGIEGVRVELLAKQLNVTKGSFYWHFKDRDALYQSMLQHWRRRATVALIERRDQDQRSPLERLQRLVRLQSSGGRSAIGTDIELAIRLWGRSDARARIAVQEVDELRLRYIEQLMTDAGVPAADAEARAILAYSYAQSAGTLMPVAAKTLMQRCEALLIGPTTTH